MPKKLNSIYTLKSERIDGGVRLMQFRISDIKRDGDAAKPVDVLPVRHEQFPEEIAEQIADYGLVKVLADRTSGQSQDANRLDLMRDYVAMFENGTWEREGVRSGPLVSVYAEAIAMLKNCSVAQAQVAWRELTDEQKAKITAREDFQKCLKAVQAAREASEAISLDDLAEDSDAE